MSQLTPMQQAAIGSFLRWALMFVAAWFVKHGIWSPGDASSYVAAGAISLTSLGWSQWQKYQAQIRQVVTQRMAQVTLNQVNAQMATGVVPSVTTLAHVVPVAVTK
jgi:hypothetical protein